MTDNRTLSVYDGYGGTTDISTLPDLQKYISNLSLYDFPKADDLEDYRLMTLLWDNAKLFIGEKDKYYIACDHFFIYMGMAIYQQTKELEQQDG